MSRISNIIEEFINGLIHEAEDGVVEIQRNELAEHFDCAPSQINYVLSTRFTPYRGYYVESKRGGGGYIRIVKVEFDTENTINELITNTIGDSITKNKSYGIIDTLKEEDIITERETYLMKVALGDRSLACNTENRNELRADILKNMLLIFLME